MHIDIEATGTFSSLRNPRESTHFSPYQMLIFVSEHELEQLPKMFNMTTIGVTEVMLTGYFKFIDSYF